MQDKGAFYLFNENGKNKNIIICSEHSGYETPTGYENMGIPSEVFNTSISHDIGIREVAIYLAKMLDCTLFLGKYSRLLIDLNRTIIHKGIIKYSSFMGKIPLNKDIDEGEFLKRINEYYRPYHLAISDNVKKYHPAILSLHSFTPAPPFLKTPRKWTVCVAYSKKNKLANHIITEIEKIKNITVGINKPFDLSDSNKNGNGTAYQYGIMGFNSVLFEIKNDEILDDISRQKWAKTIHALLPDFIKDNAKD